MQCCSHTHGSHMAHATGGGCKVGLHTTTHINNNPCTLRHRTPAAVRTKKETNVMKKTVIRIMTLTKWALVGAALFAAFAWAGKSDYVDSTVVEMKNNGTYYALSERFPDYSDADLVHYYVEHCK